MEPLLKVEPSNGVVRSGEELAITIYIAKGHRHEDQDQFLVLSAPIDGNSLEDQQQQLPKLSQSDWRRLEAEHDVVNQVLSLINTSGAFRNGDSFTPSGVWSSGSRV